MRVVFQLNQSGCKSFRINQSGPQYAKILNLSMINILPFVSDKLMKNAKNKMKPNLFGKNKNKGKGGGSDNCNCPCREYWTTRCAVEYQTGQLIYLFVYSFKSLKKLFFKVCYLFIFQNVSNSILIENANEYLYQDLWKSKKLSVKNVYVIMKQLWKLNLWGKYGEKPYPLFTVREI